eukprot:1707836-Pyramimonas_sp.AAC.1
MGVLGLWYVWVCDGSWMGVLLTGAVVWVRDGCTELLTGAGCGMGTRWVYWGCSMGVRWVYWGC